LIITPTRELAMQIVEHMKAAAKHTNLTIIGLVGGLSTAKQERTLNGSPDVVVATPGRLWELMETATVCICRNQS
jgi:ATP-dependent RNA helicase DDX24/MAK5